MPHVDPDEGMPKTAPRPNQAQIPVTAKKRSRNPFLEEISMADFKLDQRLVDQALGVPDDLAPGTEAFGGRRNSDSG